MKHKWLGKALACVLAGTMLCSLFAGCGGKTRENKDWEELGYQWEDTEAPIVKEKGVIEFEVLAQKNSMTPNYNDLQVFNDLEDETYVDINWENITESAYAERKTLILSDRENWPDAGFSGIWRSLRSRKSLQKNFLRRSRRGPG